MQIGFSTQGIGRLKLVEFGVAREKLSVLTIFLSPIVVVVPFFFKKFLKGPKPLSFFRLLFSFG